MTKIKIERGKTTQFTYSHYGNKRTVHIPKTFLNKIPEQPGHTISEARIEAKDSSWFYTATYVCSCGFELSDGSRAETARTSQNCLDRWNAHIEGEQPTVLLFEAKPKEGSRKRLTHKGYLSSPDNFCSLIGREDWRTRWANNNSHWVYGFIIKSNGNYEFVTSEINIEKAHAKMLYRLSKFKNDPGYEVTEYEIPHRKQELHEAADLLGRMSAAETLTEMMAAKRQAEEYLQYAEIIQSKLGELHAKIAAS